MLVDDVQLSIAKAYDDFPYEGYPYPLTHPERLATIASLFAMQPPPAESARVLELGCGTGGNLIPMALAMPRATFVGYDLSGVHIQSAQATVKALGLGNIELGQRNILDIGADAGKFDYIVCHGVLSWVPEDVQDKILSICRGNLNENGVALVSYNTYPGWHMRESIRDMMRYHTRQFADPAVRVTQARALLDFVAKSVDSEKNAYGMYLASELKLLSGVRDSYIAHDHLERWNAPMYFHQFVDLAGRHGMQYLGESEFSTMLVRNFAKPVAETLSKVARDVVQMEQYMDFVRNRTFRSSLICHQEQRLDRNVDSARLLRLLVACPLEASNTQSDLTSTEREQFKTIAGAQFGAAIPVTKAALRVLASTWPRAIPFMELLEGAQRLVSAAGGPAGPDGERGLSTDLLQLYASGVIELHSTPSRFVTAASAQPCASALIRLQASHGASVTNLRHESLRINDVERRILGLLDGQRSRAEIVERLVEGVVAGELSLKRGDQPLTDAADVREQIGRLYEQILPHFGRKALLVA